MGRFTVQLGAVYGKENVAGTAADPTPDPTTVAFLDPIFMSIGVNGTLNELRCLSNALPEVFMAPLTSSSSSGSLGGSVARGQWIQVTDTNSENTIFDGIVVNQHVVISGDATECYVVAFDHASFLMKRMTLHGQYRRSNATEQTYFTSGPSGAPISVYPDTDIVRIDEPMIFNPEGSPNMTDDTFKSIPAGTPAQPFHIFEAPFRRQAGPSSSSSGTTLNAQYWTLKDAVAYILQTTNVSWCIDPLTYTNAILTTAFVPNPLVSNINVEGKTVAQALTDLMEPHNYGWWVDPALNLNNLHDIHFYFRGSGTAVTLKLDPRGTNQSSGTANLVHFDGLFDNASTVNYLEAYGAPIEVTTLGAIVKCRG